ncbi:hypothetical protein RhiJN_11986 [Ceratobasidium sp. AG-Ba]|nr:hypothetical protein RhiJN_11986 [Ceratobasidium sp. AG-Ba]
MRDHFRNSSRKRLSRIHFQLATMFMILAFCAEARPALVPRAIVRPIPMPGFNVSVFDEGTGAPIPQVQASDGGGLVGGRVFSAPNVVWAIAGAGIGLPLGGAGVKLWRVTTALGSGLSVAFAMWAALVNTMSETGLAPSQSMSDMLILLITGAAFLIGTIGGAFRIAVVPAMAATCAIGGASIAIRAIILRPGLLVPPGLNQQLAFVNIVIVAVGILCGGLSVVFNQRGSMIFATASVGSFLLALATDLLLNGQKGMSRGLRIAVLTFISFVLPTTNICRGSHSLFTTIGLGGGGYRPPLSSQIVVASSLGLILILSNFNTMYFRGPSYSQEHGTGYNLSLILCPMKNRAFGRRAATKPANERRGSAAYNYGTGAFALPSEILRQESRRNNSPLQPVQQTLDPRQPQPPAPRNPPLVEVQRPLPVLREEPRAYTQAYNPAYGPGPRGAVAGDVTRGPIGRAATIPVRPLRPDGPFPATVYPNQWATAPQARGSGVSLTSRTNGLTPAPSPGAAFEPASTPRMRIGMGMLRPLSADSIIDAYGGTADSGYRYGGARVGQGGRI